jgi:thiol-disulfide isomerase/thioredoxin
MSSSSVAGGASTQGAVNSVVGSGASNIINTITTFLNSSNGRMVIFAVVFILIIIGVIQYIYTNNISPDITKFINNITGKSVMSTNDDKEEKNATLYLFKVDWCPHCKKAEPVFKEVEDKINGEKIPGYNITFKVIDCEADPTMADKFGVTGYPTIKLDKEGEIIEYDAKPDKDNLLDFLNKVLTS